MSHLLPNKEAEITGVADFFADTKNPKVAEEAGLSSAVGGPPGEVWRDEALHPVGE